MGYTNRVPESIIKKAVADLVAYKAKHKLSEWALGKKLGTNSATIRQWGSGKVKLTSLTVTKLIDAGITDVKLPEQVRQDAIASILRNKDKHNHVPRAYRKHVAVPEIIGNQMKLILDEYVKGLKDSRTWEEHEEQRNTMIGKLFHLAKQGE